MQNNTDAFSWKRGKDKIRELTKKNIPCKLSFFLLLFIFLFQRCFKETITDLYEHIENVVGTKFQNYHRYSFGVHNRFFL